MSSAYAPESGPGGGARPSLVTRLIGIVLVLAVFVAGAVWLGRMFAPKPVKAVRSWDEPVPQVTLTPAERAAAAAMPAHPGAVVVLTYHEVSNRSEADGATTYTLATEAFTRQMAALKEAGYRTVTSKQVLDFVQGKGTLPPRAVLLTFDDGHASDVGVADKVLAKYGFTAAGLVITGSVKPANTPTYHLNVEQFQKLRASGRWELGSHTHGSHYRKPAGALPLATALDHRLTLANGKQETMAQWQARVAKDLTASQRWLTAQLGAPAKIFAFPYGAYSSDKTPPAEAREIQKRLAALLKRAGFQMAFAGAITRPEKAVLAGDNPYALRRLSVPRGMDGLGLLKAIKSVVPSPVVADPLSLRWTGKDARCVVSRRASTLTISSRIHDVAECRPWVNSSQWQDYTLRVRVRGVTDKTWAIISIRDGAQWAQLGRVEVSVQRRTLYVKEIISKGGRKLGGKHALGPEPPGGHLIRIRAVGDKVSVFVDDRLTMTRTTRTKVPGGITFTVIGPKGTAIAFDKMALAPWAPPTAPGAAADAAPARPETSYQFPTAPGTTKPFVRLN